MNSRVIYSERIVSSEKDFFFNCEAFMPLSASKVFPEGQLKNCLLNLESTLTIKCDVLIQNNDEITLHNIVTFNSDSLSGIQIGISCPILKKISDQHQKENGIDCTLFDESLGIMFNYEDINIIDLENYSQNDLIDILQEKGKLLIEEYQKLDEGSIGRKFDFNGNELVQEIIDYAFKHGNVCVKSP